MTTSDIVALALAYAGLAETVFNLAIFGALVVLCWLVRALGKKPPAAIVLRDGNPAPRPARAGGIARWQGEIAELESRTDALSADEKLRLSALRMRLEVANRIG